MKQKTKALLFDLDGTLLDTAPEFTVCLNTLLKEEGLPSITVEALRSRVSYGAKGMVEFGFNMREDHAAFSSLKERFLSLYAANLGQHTVLFPGIAALIGAIEQQKLVWGIVTNKFKNFTFPLVDLFPVLKNTAIVIAGDTLPTQKPDPAPLLLACQTLQISPEDCWYIGDAKTDVEASKRAGMRSAVAQYGYIPPGDDPRHWQADAYIQTSADIANLIV